MEQQMPPEQDTWLKLIVANSPLKHSPIILDVIDESHKHIMGGDPLQPKSLFFSAIQATLAKSAINGSETWLNSLKDVEIDTFAGSSFVSSPEIMLSILENCKWAPVNRNIGKQAEISIGNNFVHLEIDGKTYLKMVSEKENYSFPSFLPYLIRHLCHDEINKIDVHFQGAPVEILCERHNELFNILRNSDLTQWNGRPFAQRSVKHGYFCCSGTMFHSRADQALKGMIVFAKFFEIKTGKARDVIEVIMTDFDNINMK